MTTTDELLKVIHAYQSGDPVESCRHGCGSWWFHDGGIWNTEGYDYRIKPKPREWWVNVRSTELCSSIGLFAYDTIELANAFNSAAECVHVREVL